jgi:uncharacterized protein
MTTGPHHDFSMIPAIDHHCHNWKRQSSPFSAEEYRLLFTEALDRRVGLDVPSSIYYRWTIRELAARFEVEANERAVLDARAALGPQRVAEMLMAEANVKAAIVDFGFVARGSDLFTVEEMSACLGGASTTGAIRIERVLEDLVLEYETADQVEEAFRARLNRTHLEAERIVSLKSIIAYRTGLDVSTPSRADACGSFAPLKKSATERGAIRINNKEFLDYFLGIALQWANDEQFPFQFHTGFGDPSVFLRTGNPITLRPVFENRAFSDVPIVLLHAGWPYVRESSYLASVYNNFSIDCGLAIPFVASDYEAIWRELLSLAPTSKILWSSDGFSIPEHCWFAAVQGRKALAGALVALVKIGAIGDDDVLPIGEAILNGNATRLYGLDRFTSA